MMPEKPKKTQGKQVAGFRKAARELEADESESRFDTALKTVAKHKPTAQQPPKRS